MTTSAATSARNRKEPTFKRHDDLADAPVTGGDRDHTPISELLELVSSLPVGPAREHGKRSGSIAAARTILEWLRSHPADGWQDRWVVSGADEGLDWIDALVDPADPRAPVTQRDELLNGLGRLLLCRVFFPSFGFFTGFNSHSLFRHVRAVFRPDLFDKIEQRADALGVSARGRTLSIRAISKIVLHTGRDPGQLTAEDLLAYRSWHMRTRDGGNGVPLAWTLLQGIADLGEHATLDDVVRHGQRPTHELVALYDIQNRDVRDVLIRYLQERRLSMDFSSFTGLVARLAGLFWSDIEQHHPEVTTLHLPEEVATAWKQRLRTVRSGTGERSDGDYIVTLMTVRAFYRDLQEWAMHDPSWARWSYPSPIRKSETAGQASKVKQRTVASTHQRIRERMPHLPALVDSAERHKNEQAALLAATRATPIGSTFEHAGRGYRRTMPKSYTKPGYRHECPPDQVEDLATGELVEIGKQEHEAFWSWAIIETLRHTGVRIEELQEITHLGLVSYKLPKTGELVPMLQIVPSKINEERLLLVGPELASVLATIITRLRTENNGHVPLTARYDEHERITGLPLPHLFQHRLSWHWKVPSANTIQHWLNETLQRAGLTDTAGQPLRFTPHDFRRLWATEAVTSGLPIHIAARLMGHKNLNTTQTYVAVFDEELVRSYRAFLDTRRALRPSSEYREPTDQEWHDFQQHFELRKLELGTCGRPYGSPCKHEHACLRCPSLRVDPRARTRIVEIIANLRDRITEARVNGWTGEVEGLTVSLNAAAAKLVGLDRMNERPSGTTRLTELGMPVIQEGTGA
ncbi:tyrosine-type recombinase/integrase [Nocardia sp. SYP-A9097]|uniref:tyrosine-type recombinase/integrase n=1 Tax=Nocardia sp. SYP-A9097 TaxID=2663237 RepID=UPI00129A5223|nr:site-specific integrase [Nocardia sp. SYP-A9097]MRH93050.1 tyrosine-type recombinase/integrase [Nocardia sp. SYP-A9097]